MKRVANLIQLFFLFVSVSYIGLAAGEVDTNFRATLTESSSASGTRTLILPDGKILVAVRVPLLDGSIVGDLVRLNANGTVDTSFNPPTFTPPVSGSSIVHALAALPDGKILIGGNFTTVNFVERVGLARLNADGSLDTTFPNVFPQGAGIEQILVYPDGRILVGGISDDLAGPLGHLTRLSADGVVDPTFDYSGDMLTTFVLQPDGKVVTGERSFSSSTFFPKVRRYNDNGSPDPTFTQIDLRIDRHVSDMKYLPDGKILVSGSFTTVNGASRTSIFRSNADGSIDSTFQDPGLNTNVNALALTSDGKYLIAGSYTQIGGVATSRKMHRLNTDGTRDTSFNYFDSSSIAAIRDIEVQPDGKVVVISGGSLAITRVNSDGSMDNMFSRPVGGSAGDGNAVLVQADNKILVGGRFNFSNLAPRGCLTRLNADGTLDTGFAPPGFCGPSFGKILAIVQQPDGKILIAGDMASPVRLNADGSSDGGFPSSGVTFDIDYLPDGKVLVSSGILNRFNSNGSLDVTLATVTGVQFPNIYKTQVQPDGKIIIVGHFTNVNGTPKNYIARLNADGSLDGAFNATANADISTVLLQADGKILIGGGFTSVNGNSDRKYLARLNSDGTLDSSFAPVLDGPVLGLKVQPDGKILFGGAFASVSGVPNPRLGRVNTDGSRDATFNVGTGANSTVWSIDMQSDGKIVYAGEFDKTNGISTLGVGRLLNLVIPPKKFFDYDGDGKADVSVFRASENKWYILRSYDFSVYQPVFAIAGDIPVPADYDGDQKTDVAIFRPSNAQWWYLSSIDGSQVLNPFGATGDIPRPSDFDGDGKTDFVLFRPSNNTWYRFGSLAGNVANQVFGVTGDQPVIGDFDGDGKSDLAVFRPSTGDWWYAASSAGGAFRQTHWGQNGDLPVPADYDGDSKTDFAVFRPSDGGWYVLNSSNGSFTTTAFGTSGDRPVAADYDGDGRADLAVFRPSTGIWYLLRSTSGFAGLQFGISTDTPTQSVYVPF